MSLDKTLLIATMNPGKVIELRAMLDPLGIAVVGLDRFPSVREVPETGTSFVENAILKASGYARLTGLPALADDSGLELAGLGGGPGVLSARYGGDDLPFSEKIRLLLGELDAAGSSDRSARFVSSIALAASDGEIVATTDGVCNGHLARSPRGSGGFGYDPVFIPQGYTETFGELSGAVKAQISHRAHAFLHMMPILRRFFGIST